MARVETGVRWLRLADGPVAIVDVGRGPAIVLVHGAPGDHRDFRHMIGPLAGHRRVVAVNLPGFGLTPAGPSRPPTVAANAAIVVAVARALRLQDAVVGGHSYGGAVAVAAAATGGDAFAGLATFAGAGVRPHAGIRRAPMRALSRALATPLLGRALVPWLQRGYAKAGLGRDVPSGPIARSIDCAARLDFDAQRRWVAAWRGPALAAWCLDDHLIDAPVSEELAAALPDGPRLVFERGGHAIVVRHAGALAEALVAFPP